MIKPKSEVLHKVAQPIVCRRMSRTFLTADLFFDHVANVDQVLLDLEGSAKF